MTEHLPVRRRAIAYGYSRRLDRGPQARVERPSLDDKSLIVERRSLRSALRAPVETTEIAICDSPHFVGRKRFRRFGIGSSVAARRARRTAPVLPGGSC